MAASASQDVGSGAQVRPMTYIDQSLGDNETLRYRARFPAIRYWAAYLALGLFLLVAYVALQRGATYSAMALALTGDSPQ